ncbi:MAG: ABC transporter permease, partial [Enterocloster aldenensis]|nr:ABC transporter permease [Enterocloster aldenensis]
GASVIAFIMIIVTLGVIKGFNALALRLDRRGGNYA